jgi:hypothetical protein
MSEIIGHITSSSYTLSWRNAWLSSGQNFSVCTWKSCNIILSGLDTVQINKWNLGHSKTIVINPRVPMDRLSDFNFLHFNTKQKFHLTGFHHRFAYCDIKQKYRSQYLVTILLKLEHQLVWIRCKAVDIYFWEVEELWWNTHRYGNYVFTNPTPLIFKTGAFSLIEQSRTERSGMEWIWMGNFGVFSLLDSLNYSSIFLQFLFVHLRNC